MKENTRNGFIRGGLAATVAFILGMVWRIFNPEFTMDWILGMVTGTFMVNFLLECVKKTK